MQHLSRKIIFPKLVIRCSKMQPLSGNLRPDLLTHLPHVSLALRLSRDMHLSRASCHRFGNCYKNPHVLVTFGKVQNPPRLPLPRKTTSERPKVLRARQFFVLLTLDFETCFTPQRRALFQHLNFQKCSERGVLHIFTCKCASRHNGAHFFDISTSKSGPRMVCLIHFDFEICFEPHPRAIVHLSSGQMAPHRPL